MGIGENIEVVRKEIGAFPKSDILKSCLQTAFEAELPIAIWRLPSSDEINLLTSFGPAQRKLRLDLEEAGQGFAFGPFQAEKGVLFIPGDFHCSLAYDEVSFSHASSDDSNQNQNSFVDQVFKRLEARSQSKSSYHVGISSDEEYPDYVRLVEHAVAAIQEGEFQKVVPARKKEITLDKDFDAVDTLLSLCDCYPNAFVSLVSIPGVGTWMGATPEVLLEVENGNTFKTVALAATQKRDESKALSETAWTQKEIEEQAMVSRYIINCFKKIRLREFEERGPKTVGAGNLLHLKTDYAVDMVETNFPQLGTVMLELLHPTSAVAGMPKEASLAFLNQNEGFDREFFSGFLGPVNIEQSTNLYVNLRCMQLFEETASLYAGAGITEDSIPEKELLETEMKFNTLLNVIDQRD